MSRFSSIARGVLTRRCVEVRLFGDAPIKIDVRPLSAGEEADVIARAHAYCKERGRADAKAGDELFEIGRMVHTVALGCVDQESPPESPRPFFDGGVKQILDPGTGLHPDCIVYLFEAQRALQEECSPTFVGLNDDQFIAKVVEVAVSNDDLPFERLRPALRASFVRTLARLHLRSLEHSSPSGSDSEPSSSDT